MSWFNRILTAINIALLVVAAYAIARYGLGPAPPGWKWSDLVLIVLVALSVILAALTIFLAILGVAGYTRIRDEAIQRAENAARDKAEAVTREEVPRIAIPEARRQAAGIFESMEPSPDALTSALTRGDDDDTGEDSR